jgi:hypothetical protein
MLLEIFRAGMISVPIGTNFSEFCSLIDLPG